LKEKVIFCAALPLTLITLSMSVMNLVEGAQNFQVFVEPASLESEVCYGLLELIVATNLLFC
jgi:hypothetical protein